MSTMGMQVELSMTAKGVQATLKDAQGAILQTAQIAKTQLGGGATEAAGGIMKLKEGMGRARETAMFFTQSLGAFGETGRQVQGAVSGLVGAFIGGGGVLLAMQAATTAIQLLTSAWEADGKAAEEAGKKAKQSAKDIADAMAQVAKSQTDRADAAKYTERMLLERQYRDALVKINKEIAESRKRTGDDVTSEETKALLVERQRLAAEYQKAKAAISENQQIDQVNAGAASLAKAEEEKRRQLEETARKRDQETKDFMARISAELKAEEEAANERGRLALMEQELEQRRAAAAMEKQQKATQEMLTSIKPITDSIQTAFAGVVDGSLSVGKALRQVLASSIQAFMEMALRQVTANAAVAGSGAAASQASVPIIGPALAAAAMAAVMGMVLGLTSMISASGGADIGNYAPLAQLHPKEMVLPAHIAEPLRDNLASGGLGGGGQVVVNISAVDAKGVRRLLLDNGPALAEAIGKAVRDGRNFG